MSHRERASCCSITNFMADVQMSYSPWFYQSRLSQLGPTKPHTLNSFLLVPFISQLWGWSFTRSASSPEELLHGTDFTGDIYLIMIILTSSCLGSTVIYSSYCHNIAHLPPSLYTLTTVLCSNPLSGMSLGPCFRWTNKATSKFWNMKSLHCYYSSSWEGKKLKEMTFAFNSFFLFF